MWVRNREEKNPKYSFTLSLMSSSNCHQIPGFPFTPNSLKESSTHPAFPTSLPLTLQTTPSWFLSPILPWNCPCQGHQPMWTLSRIFPLPDSQQQPISNLLLSKHLPIPSFPPPLWPLFHGCFFFGNITPLKFCSRPCPLLRQFHQHPCIQLPFTCC